MSYTKPLPDADPLMEPFWENARKHKLSVQSCRSCGDRHFPPGPVCPVCLSDDQDWEVVSGRARLISWVTFHRAYWDGFAKDVPYDVCLVQLEEGPWLMSNFLGARPENAAEGLPLKAAFDDLTENFTLPKFVAA
jgi:uncharacterized OB-fold protein